MSNILSAHPQDRWHDAPGVCSLAFSRVLHSARPFMERVAEAESPKHLRIFVHLGPLLLLFGSLRSLRFAIQNRTPASNRKGAFPLWSYHSRNGPLSPRAGGIPARHWWF